MKRSIQNICCTSIDDARSSLYHIDDLALVKGAITYEIHHGQRTTMIRMLKSKIRQLEKSNRKSGK